MKNFTLSCLFVFSLLCNNASAQNVNLGTKVWWDVNDNGSCDAGEWAGQWVGVTLYQDNDDNGIADAGFTPVNSSTDGYGNVMFSNLAPGKYFVRVNAGYSHYKSTTYGGDPDNNIIGDNNGHAQNTNDFYIKTQTIELQPGTEPDGTGATNTNTNKTIELGMWKDNGLGDFVWLDANANGVQDNGEQGIANVTVTIKNSAGATLGSTTTDAQGRYYFYDAMGTWGINDYQLEFSTPFGYAATVGNMGSDDANDSDPINGVIPTFNVPAGQWNHTFDAGFRPANILPLSLLTFTATLKNDLIDLKWSTSNEVNVDHIMIEKSMDGVNYSDLAMVFTNNNGATNNFYQYQDKVNTKVDGTFYYRLRIVNANGKSTLSEVKIVRIKTQNAEILNIVAYPNPVVNEVNITIPQTWHSKPVQFRVTSITGALVNQITVNNATKVTSIPFSNLPAGSYNVSAYCNGKVLTQKIIKQ
jgi:hypothetical protein